MKYYKDANDTIYAYETSEDREKFGDAFLTEMTSEEVAARVSFEKPKNWPRFFGNKKLDLFTSSEQLAIATETMQDPQVKLLYDRLIASAYWSYEDPETEYGLSVLVEKGLLTEGRKSEIVALMQ